MRIALYQPEIPQNTGTILRLGACMGVGVDIIEPCGFVFSDRKMLRSGMDYIDQVDWQKHPSWEVFLSATKPRIILLTPNTDVVYTDFEFTKDDVLLLGKESSGVPQEIADTIAHKVVIPMRPECRSINIAISAAMVLGEALRQLSLCQPQAS